MCREVFKKFKACVNVQNINTYREDRNAIDIVYKSLQQDRNQADISEIIRELQRVVDAAIEPTVSTVAENPHPDEDRRLYDISQIDFDRLKREFARIQTKNTTVQNLRQAVEQKLQRLMQQNPLRTDFQHYYEEIVATYNREKDQITIERTFEALLKLVQELDKEENRAVREGLDEESLSIFDLLKKPDLNAGEIAQIKKIAKNLLKKLKVSKLRVHQWREKEATRDAVWSSINDFLYNDQTGLPDRYTLEDIETKTEAVFHHIYRAYPKLPSPYYESAA